METDRQEKIILGILTGDETVLKVFYQENFPLVRVCVLKNSGNVEDVEDIFQDALILLYQKLKSGSLSIDSSIHNYFYGICKNLWKKHLRKTKKVILGGDVIRDYKSNATTVIEKIEFENREQLYQTHYQKLNNSTKEFWRLFFEGKSVQEISNITGHTEGYIRKKKCESKKLLITSIREDRMYVELAS